MKQWALAWVAWALAGAALAVEATPPARHTVEAQVNGRVITTRDVYRQVESRWKELIRGKDQAEKAGRPYDLEQLMNEAWIEARRELVEESLLTEAGERLAKDHSKVTEWVNDQVRQDIEKQRLDLGGESKLRDYVEQQRGLSYPEYLKRLREFQYRRVVLAREVYRGAPLRPAEIEEYYRQNLDRFREPAEVRFEQILLRVDRRESLESQYGLAREIAERIRAGEKFEDLAKALSEDRAPARDGEGALPWRRLDTLAKPLRLALAKMKPGEISDPVVIQLPGGESWGEVRVVKLVERKDERV
ncbi:MAG TPA: peptidyl-prolyl cis-trans isomerase, partial [Candidatus Brocadiia bacterium]|nr:peptidyl-prolyl cis-trans isomerase [Candidatus Brocadiia bacterium]